MEHVRLKELAAQVAHDTLCSYCELLKEDSQHAWADIGELARERILRDVSMVLDDPAQSLQRLHFTWAMARAREGWRFGEKKSYSTKIDPELVPFVYLGREQRIKYALFSATVLSVMKHCATLKD